jgi:hypothetical protein
MHSTIDARLPPKVPKQKTCQTPRKWVISDYPLLNCITARKCEILYSITANMTCIIRKFTKSTFKQFFLYLKLFSSYMLSKTRFWPGNQSLLRHFCSIFTFKTAITQRLFEGSRNCLKVLCAVFCKLSDDASHFCCNWIQNFTFSCCNTILNRG